MRFNREDTSEPQLRTQRPIELEIPYLVRLPHFIDKESELRSLRYSSRVTLR